MPTEAPALQGSPPILTLIIHHAPTTRTLFCSSNMPNPLFLWGLYLRNFLGQKCFALDLPHNQFFTVHILAQKSLPHRSTPQTKKKAHSIIYYHGIFMSLVTIKIILFVCLMISCFSQQNGNFTDSLISFTQVIKTVLGT